MFFGPMCMAGTVLTIMTIDTLL